MAIKMRVSKGNKSCTSCGGTKGTKKSHVKELFDVCIGDNLHHICQHCMADVLRLTCKMNTEYYARVKCRDEV